MERAKENTCRSWACSCKKPGIEAVIDTTVVILTRGAVAFEWEVAGEKRAVEELGGEASDEKWVTLSGLLVPVGVGL